MKTYVGIDPGKTGAVAMITPTPSPYAVDDIVDFLDADKTDLSVLVEIFIKANHLNTSIFVLLEKPQVMPGSKARRLAAGVAAGLPEGEEKEVGQGRVGILNYGIAYGEYRGMLKALKIPFAEIHPATWKAAFSLFHQPKERSIEVAKQIFPSTVDRLTLKKHHGRAEALLIAEYARRRNM